MALGPTITVRQSQSLAMTPQLRQAIKLLRMSNAELLEFVAEEVEKNPFLELKEAAPATVPSLPYSGVADGDGLDPINQVQANPTLREHLLRQVRSMRISAFDTEIAAIIIDELEDDGYLRADIAEIGTRHRLTRGHILGALPIVQSCEPAGIGARNLRECLVLQLRDQGKFDGPMEKLLDNLHLSQSGDHSALTRACGVSPAVLARMLSELRTLDPKPGLKFNTSSVQFTIPDVVVTKGENGTLSVDLNEAAFPSIVIDNVYATELRASGPKVRTFVSEYRNSANWLLRSLRQRAQTIHRVSTEIVAHQERFFSEGAKSLKPMTRRSVADRLGLHETTIGRVTSGKYLACERGVLELKYFFGSAIMSVSGSSEFSALAVQDRIRNLTENEEPAHPLSDDRMVNLLRADGIDIARRTVAKYRESMGIPSSQQRRKRNRLNPSN